MKAYYREFNVTLVGIADPCMEFFDTLIQLEDKLSLIIFGLGYWYKPFIKPHAYDLLYYHHMMQMLPEIEANLRNGRSKAKKLNPNTQSVLRTMSYTYKCDEMANFPQYFAHIPPEQGKGKRSQTVHSGPTSPMKQHGYLDTMNSSVKSLRVIVTYYWMHTHCLISILNVLLPIESLKCISMACTFAQEGFLE
ncbi:hypothetical protein EON65_56340 [archaeon]|nr:MAG: hypothetical protein EON65_56340 [archaeon]